VDGGAVEMAVATCVAWSGKPAGLITWSEHPNVGRVSQLFEVNANDTETLKSQYWMVPTFENHGRNLTCRVRHPAMTADVEMTITLNIKYQPKVTLTGYQNDWFVGKEGTLTCAADANPAVTEYTWS
uniref:Ig-like domain-containing protein n=1 Tax=Petromyzon marinus TaxID=7757 RepID=S4RGC4_PETMA